MVKEWVASQTAEEVMAAAEKIPMPCGICLTQTEVAHHPQVQARGMLTEVFSPDGTNPIMVSGIPLQMSKTNLEIERSYPAIGQHNEEVYHDLLGYSREDLFKLKEDGVI